MGIPHHLLDMALTPMNIRNAFREAGFEIIFINGVAKLVFHKEKIMENPTAPDTPSKPERKAKGEKRVRIIRGETQKEKKLPNKGTQKMYVCKNEMLSFLCLFTKSQ